MKLNKQTFFKLSALTISLVMGLVFSEVIIRSFYPQFSEFGFNYLIPDKKLRYRQLPNCRFHWITDEFHADFYTNSQGMRGGEILSENNRRKQVLFIGDSFTFGYGVRSDEVFSSILQATFNSEKNSLDIINAGVVGYGTDRQYLYLKQLLKRYSPEFVFINVFSNDLSDNIWRSLFYLEQGEFRENPPLEYTRIMKFRWFMEAKSHLFLCVSKLIGKKISEANISDSLNPYLGVVFANGSTVISHQFDWPIYRKYKGFNTDNWYPIYSPESLYKKDKGEEVFVYAWKLQNFLIDRMSQLLRSRNIPHLFVLIPTREQCSGRKTIFDCFQYEMVEIFERHNIDYLDLRDHLSGHPEYYYKKDVHWNALGHRRMADIYAELLHGVCVRDPHSD